MRKESFCLLVSLPEAPGACSAVLLALATDGVIDDCEAKLRRRHTLSPFRPCACAQARSKAVNSKVRPATSSKECNCEATEMKP